MTTPLWFLFLAGFTGSFFSAPLRLCVFLQLGRKQWHRMRSPAVCWTAGSPKLSLPCHTDNAFTHLLAQPGTPGAFPATFATFPFPINEPPRPLHLPLPPHPMLPNSSGLHCSHCSDFPGFLSRLWGQPSSSLVYCSCSRGSCHCPVVQ